MPVKISTKSPVFLGKTSTGAGKSSVHVQYSAEVNVTEATRKLETNAEHAVVEKQR